MCPPISQEPSPPGRARAIEIHSYRSVFDLERRIYRIDRVRLNPAGVPLRGVVYFLALLLAALVAASLPLLGTALGVLPWFLRDLALPVGLAVLLTAIRIDGRPAHTVLRALLGYAFAPRLTHDGGLRPRAPARWRPGEIVLLPDGSETRLRRLRCTGPAQIRVAVAHERLERASAARPSRPKLLAPRAQIELRELPGRPPARRAPAIVLARGALLRVR